MRRGAVKIAVLDCRCYLSLMKKLFHVAALLIGLPGAALSDDLTDRAVAALNDTLPGSTISIDDPRTLTVRLKSDTKFSVYLDNIARVCRGDMATCQRAIDEFAHKIAATIAASGSVRQRTDLRAVVREESYVDGLAAMMKQASTQTTIVARPLVGHLVEVCYFDRAEAMSPASDIDIAALDLDRAQAFTQCESNVHAKLPPLAVSAIISDRGIGILGGDAYASSYFIFHDEWKTLAAKFHGPLLVSVPESTAVLIAEEIDPQSASVLSSIAAKGMKKAQQPISAEVLRWTPSGWDVVAH
jgi:hypothetical protein